MKRYLIDGRFLASMTTGVDRYAYQILKEFDKICSSINISILIPANAKIVPDYQNIKVIQSRHSRFWTQIVFGCYARVHGMLPINLCNEVSVLAPKGIVCLHDVCYAETEDIYPQVNQFSEEEIQWFLKIYQRIKKRAKTVITVSEFSKQRIIDRLGIEADRIHVIGNGWQHFNQIQVDDTLMQQYPSLKDGEYYFTLTSANKNKNLQWILDASKKNSDAVFAVAGKGLDQVANLADYPNIVYVGYASDELAKTLMKHAKAFLFPSFYEGFGIPPLEALSTGAKVVVSQAASLPEIFGKAAYYISPNDSDVDLDKLTSGNVESPEAVLKYYSWENSAKKLYSLLTRK